MFESQFYENIFPTLQATSSQHVESGHPPKSINFIFFSQNKRLFAKTSAVPGRNLKGDTSDGKKINMIFMHFAERWLFLFQSANAAEISIELMYIYSTNRSLQLMWFSLNSLQYSLRHVASMRTTWLIVMYSYIEKDPGFCQEVDIALQCSWTWVVGKFK